MSNFVAQAVTPLSSHDFIESEPMAHSVDIAPSVSRMYGDSGVQGDLVRIIICGHCRKRILKYILYKLSCYLQLFFTEYNLDRKGNEPVLCRLVSLGGWNAHSLYLCFSMCT